MSFDAVYKSSGGVEWPRLKRREEITCTEPQEPPKKKVKKPSNSTKVYQFLNGMNCDICNRFCTSKRDFKTHVVERQHMDMFEKILNWSCHLCHKKLTSRLELKEHLRSREHYTYVDAYERDRHILTKYEWIYWHLRPRNVDTRVKLMIHPNEWYCCEVCYYRTDEESDWLAHINTHVHRNRYHVLLSIVGRIPSDKAECETCQITFWSKDEYKEHLHSDLHYESVRVEKYLKEGVIDFKLSEIEKHVRPINEPIDSLIEELTDPNLNIWRERTNVYWWHCILCNKRMNSREQFKLHTRSETHQKKDARRKEKLKGVGRKNLKNIRSRAQHKRDNFVSTTSS